jgi:hypothetical protein
VSIGRIDVAAATNLWASSPHATVFTHPEVLSGFFSEVHWWGASQGQEPFVAWPVPLDEQGRPTTSGWFYFVGPMWARSAYPPPAHRALSATLKVYTGLIDALVENYGGFQASIPPPQDDVRAFAWWRYADGAPIRITPRYSARIEALSRPWDDIMAGMRQLRRRELRRTEPVKGLAWSRELEAEELSSLYLQRVSGNPLEVMSETRRLLDLVSQGWGSLSVARDADGTVAAAIVVLSDGRTANVVVNSVADSWRQSGVSVHNMSRTIAQAREEGHESFDFNGANSPARGDDKHSYGAVPVLYFDVAL